MASTTILINKNSERGAELDALITRLKSVMADFAQVKREIDQTAFGSPPDWAAVQSIYGLYSPEDAEAIYNLIGSVSTILNTDAFIGQLTSRV